MVDAGVWVVEWAETVAGAVTAVTVAVVDRHIEGVVEWATCDPAVVESATTCAPAMVESATTGPAVVEWATTCAPAMFPAVVEGTPSTTHPTVVHDPGVIEWVVEGVVELVGPTMMEVSTAGGTVLDMDIEGFTSSFSDFSSSKKSKAEKTSKSPTSSSFWIQTLDPTSNI